MEATAPTVVWVLIRVVLCTRHTAPVVASTRAPANTSPTAIGASPRSMARRTGESWRRCHQVPTAYMRSEEGRNIPSVAATAPQNPKTCQPISAAISELGPGAAREMANRSANWLLLSQPWTTTAWCCISGMVAWPPPMDRIESGAKTRSNASALRSMAWFPFRKERQADADRNQSQQYGNHRQPQYPYEGENRHRGQRRCEITRQTPSHLDAHGERGPDTRGRESGENEVHRGEVAKPAIQIAEAENHTESGDDHTEHGSGSAHRAAQLETDVERHIDPVGARHDPRHGHAQEERSLTDPAEPIHDLTMDPRLQAAAERHRAEAHEHRQQRWQADRRPDRGAGLSCHGAAAAARQARSDKRRPSAASCRSCAALR